MLCSSAATASNPSWLEEGGFIPVILGIIVMFWGISFICEEYGVPSITAFCKRNNFSDSFAGSIFIGTGLSLPVFFVALAGLFISNSAIGVGAVVGGNLFNHLVTIASSIYICPSRKMKLDAMILTRESVIYLLSCFLLVWSAKGEFISGFSNAFSKSEWSRCLSIHWEHSLALLAAYVLYCLFNANFHAIEEFIQTHIYSSKRNMIPVEQSARAESEREIQVEIVNNNGQDLEDSSEGESSKAFASPNLELYEDVQIQVAKAKSM